MYMAVTDCTNVVRINILFTSNLIGDRNIVNPYTRNVTSTQEQLSSLIRYCLKNSIFKELYVFLFYAFILHYTYLFRMKYLIYTHYFSQIISPTSILQRRHLIQL